MSISSEKQKASTAWLEDRLRELTPEQFNGADHISPLPDRHIPGCPDKRREFLYGGTRVYLVPGFRKTNPFLVNSLAFLAEKYPQQMDDAARAFGVEDCNCSAYKLSETPCVLIDKLPTVYPDGERTVFQLMADAIRQKLTTSAAEPVSTAASPASQPPKPSAKGKAKPTKPRGPYEVKITARQRQIYDYQEEFGTAATAEHFHKTNGYINRTVKKVNKKLALLKKERAGKSVCAKSQIHDNMADPESNVDD